MVAVLDNSLAIVLTQRFEVDDNDEDYADADDDDYDDEFDDCEDVM